MGCASSKRVEATAVEYVYRPAPASFALFDINAIEEPWIKADQTRESMDEKLANVPAPILDKLKSFEVVSEAPHSWDEISKALEDLKPTIAKSLPATSPKNEPVQSPADVSSPPRKIPRKSFSFHTLEELENKVTPKPKPAELRKSESMRNTEFKKPQLKKLEMQSEEPRVEVTGVVKPVRENMFILRDRMEREREGKEARFDKMKRDPLSDYPEKCPLGGADTVVLYTTSLRGVRRTYEDCNRVKTIFEIHRVVFDERDVSLHGGFLNELKETLSGGGGGDEEERMISVPRVFVKGRYIGGAEEVVELNETGRLGRILNSARVERGVGRQTCEGCGGARFVPCWECGGSCKVVVADKKDRCSKCNENGLVQCPTCV